MENAIKLAGVAKDIRVNDLKRGEIDNPMAIPADTTINGVPANVLRPVPDLIRILRDEIFVPGGPLSPLAQGDPVALMQSDQAKVRIINNTYTAGLEERTASFLTAQGMQVVEFGPPTGASNTTKIILYSSKLYACLLYTSPSPRDRTRSRMPSSACKKTKQNKKKKKKH